MEKTTALSPFKTMQISTKTSLTSESKRGWRLKKHSSKSSEKSSYLKTNNNRSSPLENAKDELEVFCVQMNKGIDISEKEKEEVDERVKNVEKYYQSSLMSSTMENVANGCWRVIYSTAPPPSNGQLFGPIVGTAFQSIDKEEKTYENVLALGNWLTLRLKATYEILENTNNTRWTVTFRSIQVELFEKKEPVFVKAFPKGTTREWLTTFQDDEWRIVRAGRTKEEISKNVFVMRREKPWWET
ncbi:unnamed protein product [Bathycoccus prasinos]|jgi:hypothetical protein|tara:strand:- start:2 stop:730 length:729 start_codon:yes stop_codon:yes gene_type:complete